MKKKTLKITCTTPIVSLKSPFFESLPGPKQELGNRNCSLFLPHFLVPVMCFTKLNKPPLSNKTPKMCLKEIPQGA